MKGKKQIKGAGLIDFFKDPIGHIKEASNAIPTKLNNISTKTLQQYGDYPIQQLTIIRSPLRDHWTQALNTVSFGKFDELKKKYGYDKLFHLSLIAKVNNQDIIIEKNEVVHIAPLIAKKRIGKDTQYFNVPLNKTISLNEMIHNTKQLMTDSKFYDYDALGNNEESKSNNCQDFVRSLLKSVNLLTPQANRFITQDVSNIVKDLKASPIHKYVPEITHKVTRFGSTLSRLIGKGKENKEKRDYLMTKNMIKFINDQGFAFL